MKTILDFDDEGDKRLDHIPQLQVHARLQQLHDKSRALASERVGTAQ